MTMNRTRMIKLIMDDFQIEENNEDFDSDTTVDEL